MISMIKGETEGCKKFRVLVVDDDRAIRLVLRYVLEAEGYEVAEAGDGARALDIYGSIEPDIVLMDCMMPVLDGFSACAGLRDLYGGRAPVLMLTGLNDDRSVELAFEAGAVDIISKPINWAALRQRVSRLLKARQTEELLDRSEARANSIFAQSLDGIITIDQDGFIQSFNPAAESIFGYTSKEVAQCHIGMLIPGAQRREGSGEELPPAGGAGDRDITGRRRDGTLFPVEFTASGLYSGRRLLTVRDITDRRQAEEKIRLAAKVFESISDGIMVTDAAGKVISVNSAFTAITGYSAGEAVGRNPRLLKSGQHDSRFYKDMWASLHKSGQWQGEIWNRRKSGEIYPQWLTISAIKDGRGETIHYAAVFSDITERVRLREEKQRLMEKTARAQKMASLGTISAGIAHEINQPLNSIKVIVDGMLYWHKKGRFPDTARVIENLQKISARAGRIDEIIKHMRSFVSAGRSARLEPWLEPCKINDAVDGALSIAGHQLSSHGITVIRQPGDGLPPIMGKSNLLEEVAVNLLVNAMQALDSVPRLEKEIIIRTGLNNGKVLLEVNDNATGIVDEIRENIFEPFFSTKQAGEGMGLGLSIVHSIVTGCGGEIEAFNNDRGGATFLLSFPALPANKMPEDSCR